MSPRRRKVLTLVLVFGSLVAAAVAHVSLRLGVLREGYAISEETHELRKLEEENRKLRLELSLLRSPERIEDLARTQLGMERPDPSRIRVVRPGVREVAAATGTRLPHDLSAE